MKPEQLRELLRIDKANLDEELVNQPTLFMDVCEAAIEAVAHRDALKEEVATVDAELDGEARIKLEKHHEKVTEGMVKAYVSTDPKHEKAFKAFITAKTAADKLQALKEAYIQRNYAIRDLCGLYTANYFETSSVQGTSKTDSASYIVSRKRLAAARTERKRIE